MRHDRDFHNKWDHSLLRVGGGGGSDGSVDDDDDDNNERK